MIRAFEVGFKLIQKSVARKMVSFTISVKNT